MRDKLTMMVVEDGDNVAIELYKDSDKAKEAFENLAWTPGGPLRRATFFTIDFQGEDVKDFSIKMLEPKPPEDIDHWKLGEGPVKGE